ncbi:WYL domain-containing protein [Micromonospora marina]|uniref:WYL domain-containing protein n=1 Tax=Micromonospora marina TaxID=307120 RepID=UPI0034538EF3
MEPEGTAEEKILAEGGGFDQATAVDTALAVRVDQADTEGWLHVCATYQDRRHAEWAFWQLGANAEVSEPLWLRSALRDRAMAVLSCYGR